LLLLSGLMSPLRAPANRWLVLVLVCLAQFMVVLDATITNVALPSIQDDLGFSDTDLQWVVNGYTLLFGGFLLLGGRAADLFGRKRLFLAGIALFTLASLACGLATSSEALIVSRALQGLGAALVSPAALSIITTTFTGPDRTKALGVWGAIAAGGGAFGLLLGGVLTDSLSWEWIFFVNVPVGLAALVASARFVPESRVAGRGGFDLPGAVLATVGLVALTFAIVRAEPWGFGDARVIGFGALGLALLAAFVAAERRHRDPLVRLDLFRVRSLAAANASMLLVAGGLFAFFFFGSIYLQRVKGYDALDTGIAFLPMTAGIVIGSGLAQQLIRRFGVKPVLIGGLSAAALGMVWMTTLTPDSSYAGGLLPGLVLIALGMGNTFVPLTLTATANLGADDQGVASGIFNTSQQVGGALGLAILSTVAAETTRGAVADAGSAAALPAVRAEALVDGFTTAFTVGAVFMVVGAVLAAVGRRRRDVEQVSAEDLMTAAAPA
jgi:EmrB/QacA subfamily drug resistance transporter